MGKDERDAKNAISQILTCVHAATDKVIIETLGDRNEVRARQRSKKTLKKKKTFNEL